MSAVDVFDEQDLRVAVKLAVDYSTAGFFMQHFNIRLPFSDALPSVNCYIPD